MSENKNLSTFTKGADRSSGAVIHDGKLLLMHRKNRGKEYYTFPGGGIEKGETKRVALARELLEETSITIKLKKLLYTVIWDGRNKQYLYLCDYVSGSPALAANSIEKKTMESNSNQFYDPLWVKLEDIPKLLLYPLEVKDLFLADIKNNFKNKAKEINLSESTARQEL